MKQEEYPEKIYCSRHYSASVFTKNNFLVMGIDEKKGDTSDNVEYIRADLFPKWHKYPEEKPEYTDKNVKYLVTVKDDRGRIDIVFTKWQQFVYDNEPHWDFINSFYDERYDTVLAWQELPKSYKED